MARALGSLDLPHDPRLLVGLTTGDDAGVYKIREDLALIQTIDFITPVVDDPFFFGQIAAANALSDVYAMGGDPLMAMNVVCFPACKLDMGVLGEILKGGLSKVKEAGAVLVGGHSVDDLELKYGLSVTGVVHPEKVVTNAGARPEDLLFLTKPLGLGIVATAIKGGLAEPPVAEKVGKIMATLNRDSSREMLKRGVHACTDVTGFGLVGHGLEMARASGVTLEIELDMLPIIKEALEYAAMGLIPAGAYDNQECYREEVDYAREPGDLEMFLYDPQTSGGLLIALTSDTAHDFPWPCIGRVVEGEGRIRIL